MNLSEVTLERMKDLQVKWSRLLKILQSLKVTIKELLAVDPVSGKTLEQESKKVIKGLEKSMEQVEEKMQKLIAKDDELKRKYDLLTSIRELESQVKISFLYKQEG